MSANLMASRASAKLEEATVTDEEMADEFELDELESKDDELFKVEEATVKAELLQSSGLLISVPTHIL